MRALPTAGVPTDQGETLLRGKLRVRKFDHHCHWISNCVGEKNHGKFLLFLTTQFIVVSWGLLAFTDVEYYSDSEENSAAIPETPPKTASISRGTRRTTDGTRVRDVFVLPFHRIRRRTIFHALVLSPPCANDVRVTHGETQGLVLAAKEDDALRRFSAASSSSSRVSQESIYCRDRVQRCFSTSNVPCAWTALCRTTWAANGSKQTTPSWRRETLRRLARPTRTAATVGISRLAKSIWGKKIDTILVSRHQSSCATFLVLSCR